MKKTAPATFDSVTFAPRSIPSQRARRSFLGTALLLVMLLPGIAAASSANHWSATPAACRPDDSNWTAPVAFSFDENGSAGFGLRRTGTFTLRCNITNSKDDGSNPTDWTKSEVTYQDPSTVAGDYVKVILHQIDKSTGSDTTELLCNSDVSDGTSKWITAVHTLTKISFDFAVNTYYVEIIMNRKSVTAVEKILYVGL